MQRPERVGVVFGGRLDWIGDREEGETLTEMEDKTHKSVEARAGVDRN